MPIRRFLCPDYVRPTIGTTPAQFPFCIFGTNLREEPLLCRSFARPFKHQEEESPLLRGEIVFTMQVCMQEDQLCAFPSTDDSEGTAYAGQADTCFIGRSNNGGFVLFRRNPDLQEVIRASISGGNSALTINPTLLHSFKMVQIMILDPYVRPYAAAIGNDFILMDDNARPHQTRIVEVSGGSRAVKTSEETWFNGQGPDFYQDGLSKLVLRSDKCLNRLDLENALAIRDVEYPRCLDNPEQRVFDDMLRCRP
ncbi:hypothetical protein TNCV_4805461 [Trichonephila clavipes]|nr:hypothetical protein TNCV_4805461 [Trichonephila clavipes]